MTVQQYYACLAELDRRDKMDAMLFLQGQQDCKEGKPHSSEHGESYDRGYAAQYEMEAIQEGMSRGGY